jgi:DNA-binding NtrC family response regulator
MLKRTHRILIVDDEPGNLRLLQRVLERDHHPVAVASGQEALRVLRSDDISILITDQMMPEMNGTDLIRQARAVKPELVCMLMSSVNDTGAFIDALTKSGAVKIINKPWSAKNLLEIVAESLEKYESLMESRESISRLKQATESLDKIVRNRE